LKTNTPGTNFHHVHHQFLDLGFLLRPIYNINPQFSMLTF